MTATATPTAIAWHRGPLIGFDLETTGVNVWEDRVVTAALVRVEPGQPSTATNWLADPGVEIPDGAAEIHGITTERARAEGRDITAVLSEITEMLDEAITDGIPLVGMNLAYDFTLLQEECRRHGILPVNPHRVIDVRILDKQLDPYRKGGRKLTDLCEHYGVQLDDAHNSGADALGALRVAYKIATKWPKLQIDPYRLHDLQITWAAEQMASFAAFRRRKGEPLDDEDGSWPIKAAR